MTLLEEIQSKCSVELLNSRDHQAIADQVNIGRVKVAKKLGGIGLVLETLGPTDGAALLDTLQALTASIPSLKWAWYLIERGELDFGSTATRGMIDTLVTNGVMPGVVGGLLKAVAEVPDPITEYDVRVACYADDGDYLA